MPKLTADEIITQRHKRNFIQFGGPLPTAGVKYAGQNAQYMSVQGVTINDNGSVEPIYVPDPLVAGRYKIVNRSRSAPDLSEATLVLLEKHNAIPWQLFKQNCPFNVYEATGACADLSDFNAGWSDYMMIYSNMLVTSRDLGDRTAWDSDEAIEDSLSVTLADAYPVGKLALGAAGAAQATLEVVDVVYGNQVRCGDCGLPNDGSRFIYAVQNGVASPATRPAVLYSTDYGATWTSVTIGTAATGELVSAIGIVGDKLVVVAPTGGTGGRSCLYVSSLNTATGAPSSSFAQINFTSAFTVANTVNDMHVVSATEVYFAAQGGYIYKSTDITSDMAVVDAGSATAQNLLRIGGSGEALYAVGASAAVVKSVNRGQTWAATIANPGAGDNQAVAVLDNFRVWVGNDDGEVYFTLDGGETWTEKVVTGLTSAAVQDIAFATDEVALIAFTITGPAARLASTINGGASWVDSSQATPRLGSLPTTQRINRIAFPQSGDGSTDANNVIMGGLGTGTDGQLILGAPNKL